MASRRTRVKRPQGNLRVIATIGAQVIELGSLNATTHKVNETIGLEELAELSRIYEQVLVNLLVTSYYWNSLT
jgi:acetylornithine deacetylase/succinyl-diaminopimelate desuccinylase-like protein